MIRKKTGKGRMTCVPPEGVVFANITCDMEQRGGRALRDAWGRHNELQDELQKAKGELAWMLQDSQELCNGKMAPNIESITHKTLLEGEESRWVPPQPCVGSTQSWDSESARNARPITGNLVTTSSSPQGCTLGALLEHVSNIKAFNFPYKIKPVKLSLTVAWRGRRRRKRRRREAVSSPRVTSVMFSHNSDFHGLWD